MTDATKSSLEELIRSHSQDAGKRKRLLWIGIAAGVILILLTMAFCGGDQGPRYSTQAITRGDLTATVSATGTLKPLVEVDVGTEISGAIDSITVQENDAVKAGQILARIDTSRLKTQIQSSEAATKSAEARYQEARATSIEAKKQFDRTNELIANGWRSKSEYDTAAASRDRAIAGEAYAKAQVDQFRAALETDRTNLDKAVIRSPIDGIVLVRHVDPGQTVAAQFQTPVLFTIAKDLSQMALHVNIDEADIGQVKAGQSASFSVDAYPDKKFPARISSVRFAPETVDGVVTYEAILDVDNSDLLMRPGMTATAEIVVGNFKDRLLVANAALRFAPPNPAQGPGGVPMRSDMEDKVWIVENGQPKSIVVTLGASDGKNTEISGGDVAAGTEVIIGTMSVTP